MNNPLLNEAIEACLEDGPLFSEFTRSDLASKHVLVFSGGAAPLAFNDDVKGAALRVANAALDLARQCADSDGQRASELAAIAADCHAFVQTGAPGESYLPWSLL
jgi:hypothetical protein